MLDKNWAILQKVLLHILKECIETCTLYIYKSKHYKINIRPFQRFKSDIINSQKNRLIAIRKTMLPENGLTFKNKN